MWRFWKKKAPVEPKVGMVGQELKVSNMPISGERNKARIARLLEAIEIWEGRTDHPLQQSKLEGFRAELARRTK